MPELFKASELLKIAVLIEENGAAFHRKMAANFKEAPVKTIFNFLADEDVRHGKLFTELLKKLADNEEVESYPGEQNAYMSHFASEHVFSQEMFRRVSMEKIHTPAEALKIGMQFEIDSIMFYLGLKNYVPDHQKAAVDQIIDEERGHYLKQAQLLKVYS